MRVRSFVITFIVLTLGLVLFACQRETQTAAPPSAAGTASTATTATGPNLEEIDVTIRATGLASLMEGADPAKERILVFPKVAGHDLLLLVNNSIFTVTIPTTTAEQTDSAGSVLAKYNFAVYPSGFEVDLAASGWIAPASPQLVFTTTGDAQNEECPNDGAKNNIPATSLHWLPKMSDVNKKAVDPKKSHVKKNPKSSDNVLAQIFITDGFLDAETKSKRKFKFDTGARSGDLQQVVADYLLIRFKVWVAPGQPFVLKGRKFNPTGVADQWQEFARVMPTSNKKVEITLANVVKNDFFKLKKLGTEIPHFTALYDVLDSPKKNIKKVTYVETCPDSSGGEDGLECGPNRAP